MKPEKNPNSAFFTFIALEHFLKQNSFCESGSAYAVLDDYRRWNSWRMIFYISLIAIALLTIQVIIEVSLLIGHHLPLMTALIYCNFIVSDVSLLRMTRLEKHCINRGGVYLPSLHAAIKDFRKYFGINILKIQNLEEVYIEVLRILKIRAKEINQPTNTQEMKEEFRKLYGRFVKTARFFLAVDYKSGFEA